MPVREDDMAAKTNGAGRDERLQIMLAPEELTALDAMWDKGTNLHHALLLANRHFRKHPNAQPVLLIVTDGEPTSHLEPDGEVIAEWQPRPGNPFHGRLLQNGGTLRSGRVMAAGTSWIRTSRRWQLPRPGAR